MCGIAGFFRHRDDNALREMTARLTHRGPDSDGFFLSDPASLGMRRLAVLDVAGGRQPLADEAGRRVVVYNGEIYNYPALKKNLENQGSRFRTRTDTEVLIHLYREKGPDFVKDLNGMFAFALWDEDKQCLLLARDPLGVKPLYYTQVGQGWAFASELKCFSALPGFSRRISQEALSLYARTGAVPAPHSIYEGVWKLPPGHRLFLGAQGAVVEKYWSLPPLDYGLGAKEIETRAAVLLEEAVKSQLLSDVPLGVFLSGGLDSSAITALAVRHATGPLRTFSIGFDGPDAAFNELDKARRVAGLFHTDHREFMLKPQVADLLQPLARCFDEPFADSSAVPTYLLSREARRHVTVALTGVGGDEIFGGYPRYLGLRLGAFFEKIPNPARQWAGRAAALLPDRGGPVNWLGRAKRFLKEAPRPLAEQYQRWMSLNAPGAGALHPTNDASELALQDLTQYLPSDLLCMNDRVSMVHSLEARVPFCDLPLVEFMARVPLEKKLAGFHLKAILKKILRPLLPGDILNQTKRGFSIPLARWLKEDLRDLLEEYLSPQNVRARGYFDPAWAARLKEEHLQGRENHADTLWMALCLEAWHREYGEKP